MFVNNIDMKDRMENEYEIWKKERKQLTKIPFDKNVEDSIKEIRRVYLILKQYHFELPRLKKKTLSIIQKKCLPESRIAHSHQSKKQVCFNMPFLKRMAYINKINDLGEWRILRNNLAVTELLTHEITHWMIKGSHNKRFYQTQRRYLQTLINCLISGEYYRTFKL